MSPHGMNTIKENPSRFISLRDISLFLALTVMGAIAMLWLEIYNGYPLLYFDSAGYIHDWTQQMRPIGYNIFIRITSLDVSLCFTVFAQALITSYLMMRTAVIILGQDSPTTTWAAFAILLSVILLTNLSKYASWLMPDIFASWIFFGCFLFLMGLAWHDRVVATVALFLSLFSHLSHLPLSIAVVAVVATANLCSAKVREVIGWARLIKLITVCFVIVLSICSFNYVRGGFFALSYQRSGNFFLSHMISWGVAQEVLKEECAVRKWKLCAYQDVLQKADGKRHDWFLWNKHSPLRKVGNWRDQGEQSEIVRLAFRHHLGEIILFALRDGTRQLFTFRSTDRFLASKEILLKDGGYNIFYLPIVDHYPGDAQRLDHSRQSQGTLNFNRVIPFYITVAIGWVISLITIIVFTSKKQFFLLTFVGSSAIFVILNAFVTGGLAGVANRKQGRVAWVVLYCVLTSIAAYTLKHRKENSAKMISPVRGFIEPSGSDESTRS